MKSSGTHRTTTTVAVVAAVAVVVAGAAVVAEVQFHPFRQKTAVVADQPNATKTVVAAGTGQGSAVEAATNTGTTQSEVRRDVRRAVGAKPLTNPKVAADLTPAPLVVTAVTPGSGATGTALNAPLTVSYSEPLAGTPPLPTLNPPVAGNWTTSGSVLTFVPSGGWMPYATETVTVPAGATAMVGGHKTVSAAATTTTFKAGAGSEARLEQMLAELKYLPFNFNRTGMPAGVTSALADEPAEADAVSTSPLPGTMTWAYPNVPPSLGSLWTPGQENVIDKGAIMAFQSQHDLTMDGIAGPQVWAALIKAVAAKQATAQPYDYLMASENDPETLQVWRDGQIIYTSPANTGVTGATTQPGTFPVFLREQSGTMKGTNPDGSKYVDPGVPWIAYFNGSDAVHGFPRASYGFPQSNGCVELPISNAQTVWSMDPYGTLVTVLPPT